MADPQKKYIKPVPQFDEESRPFWEALKRHELYIQKCGECGDRRYHPRAICPSCLSDKTEWVRCGGRGKIYTFTTTYQNPAPGFRESLPYVISYVELDEGLKILTNIVDCKPEEVKIGMPVEVVFDDVTPEVTLAMFRPAR
jgi:hypothetical protein